MSNYSPWEVSVADYPSSASTSERVAFLCRFGILAPSVHNTQPWRFTVGHGKLTVSLVANRKLGPGDPTSRESWISIGACVENILMAGEYLGLGGKQTKRDATSVEYTFTEAKPNVSLEPTVNAIARRVSNRAKYAGNAIDPAARAEISAVRVEGIDVVVREDRGLIDLTADLTSRAIAIALGSPTFREELASLIRTNWTRKGTGMPGFTLGVRGPRSPLESLLVRSGTMIDRQAKLERATVESSSAVVLLFGEGDTQPYWIEAGRAYQRASLVATIHGLAIATTAAAVEAADFHLDIEKFCNTRGRLLAIMRLGHAKKPARHSPRLPIEDVLTYAS